ncbi:2S seed storage albumin protein-like [Humulus lupulus]|uniref:2S seed storage albumin protein-like n=1 Tax=Humulus lupulus TaxID=3486 RepID=UPI002B4085E7|nr:2S seed storage albumin protein-like [Humulus lupulus]
MAKLSSTVALLAALLLVAHAVAFRTTITTVESTDDDNYSSSEQECRQQVQRQGLSHCRMFMREKMHGGRYDEIENYSQHFDQCCAQLRNVNERCRCPALEMEIEREQMGSQEKQLMKESARDLPSMCKMGPQSCHFHSRYY